METLESNYINVPLIEPKLKHPTIFKVFDSLPGGGSLTIHNDHDPKPVYYQLLGERGDVFNWQYLQEGPDWWDVRITKKGENDRETIGEIAAKDLRKAQVFKKYGIDFCCGGKKTLTEVCREKNIDVTKVETELQQLNAQNKVSNVSYDDWNIEFLTDYIINTHHTYVRKYLPQISTLVTKVAQVHGAQHPELSEIRCLVADIHKELLDHCDSEEIGVFAYIKRMVFAKNMNRPLPLTTPPLADQIGGLEKEHDFVGRCLDKIRALSSEYTIPDDACTSYKLLYKMVQEFEDDLQIHIHLENNILFPKAVEMEKRINA
jgi:regulator of cell morphogenesis and NO signaling